MKWKNPTTPEEATKLIDALESNFYYWDDNTEEFLQSCANQLAKYGACFNNNFTRAHRDRIMDILVAKCRDCIGTSIRSLSRLSKSRTNRFYKSFHKKSIYNKTIGYTMTKPDFTAIAVILDRSGSMGKLSKETIEGFNSFVAEQRKVKGEAVLTLATFASDYKLVHDFVPLDSVADLTPATYVCNGYTALLDSVGRTVNSLGARLSAMPENERPSKIIVLVMTDGEENASTEFAIDKIKEMVQHQTNKYSWLFVFSGAGIDAFKGSQSLGMNTNNSRKFAATAAGVGQTYNSISKNLTQYRMDSSLNAADVGETGFFNLDKTSQAPVVVVPPVVGTPDKK